jgi:uncharacterized membrane protein (DUF485 family)
MRHSPASQLPEDKASAYKARVGLILFFVYGLIYAGFVVINTISPETMGESIVFGLNLAVVYGFGLIVLALVLGLIYNSICTRVERFAKETAANTADNEEVAA